MSRIVALLLMMCGCLVANEATKSTYEVIDWSMSPKGQPGESKGDLKHPVKNGEIIKYHVFAPSTIPDRPILGLIIGFHGTGGDENGMSGHVHEALLEIGVAQGYVVAGGKSLANAWAAGDEAAVLQFIDWLETIYPIDRRRVFAWGHSNGGWMSSWFASRHADRFAALVRWAGYGQDQPGKVGSGLEYYLVHGDNDAQVKVDESRRLRDDLRRGGHVVYREIHGGDHGSILGIKSVRDDAARWLDALRHAEIPPVSEDVKFLRQVMSAKTDDIFTQDDTWSSLVRIGGQPAWSVAVKAAKSKQAGVRSALALACARCRFADDETVATLAKLADDEDATVSKAAITALGLRANWHCPSAQTVLGKIALAKKRAPDLRTLATTSLAADMTLPLLGNTADDPILVEGTVALLDADLVDLRSAIFAPLQVAVANGLGYDPQSDAKPRAVAVTAWRGWFEERSGAPSKH